jgi:integrase/recombinase XerD
LFSEPTYPGGVFTNRRPPGILLQKAVQGFLQFKTAEGLSPRTLESYGRDLRTWLEYRGDGNVTDVTAQEVCQYISYMLSDYQPKRLGKDNKLGLSPKSARNIWITLRSFFGWLNREFDYPNPMLMVPAPKFETSPVKPFSLEEIESLLKACDHAQEARTFDRRKFSMRRPTALRDRAIILCLLDTGLRASEMCALEVRDVDFKSGKVTVKHGLAGGAKGRKGREVFMGKTTRKTLWRYLWEEKMGKTRKHPCSSPSGAAGSTAMACAS